DFGGVGTPLAHQNLIMTREEYRFWKPRGTDSSTTFDRATIEFLRAISRVAPEVLSLLAKDVLPLYKSLYLSGIEFDREYLLSGFVLDVTCGLRTDRMPISRMADELLIDRAADDDFSRLKNAIYRWAKRFYLDGWLLDAALQTLESWNRLGTSQDLD